MNIVCLGSLNIDHVYSVSHFVRGGETVRSLSLKDFCGGKGLNQSIALARAGASIFHAGRIGVDGAVLKQRLQDDHVNVDLVSTSENVPTGHAIIQVDPSGQNCIVTFGGANWDITTEEVDSILGKFGPGDLLLLQNEVSNIEHILKAAHEKGLQIAINPSPIDANLVALESLKYIKWFILNEIEGYEFTGKTEPKEICQEMRRKYPNSTIVLTLGEKGCLYYDGEQFLSQGIYKVKAVDTTAAGDTFVGYFLSGTSQGYPVDQILDLASKASAIAVSRAGASDSIPTILEVQGTELVLVEGSN